MRFLRKLNFAPGILILKYDISQFGRPWYLNDQLDLSNHTCLSDLKKPLCDHVAVDHPFPSAAKEERLCHHSDFCDKPVTSS